MLQEGADEAEWVPAQVKMRCASTAASMQAAVGGPDPFEDWFAWHEEGKDWRRCKGTKAVIVGGSKAAGGGGSPQGADVDGSQVSIP